HEWTPLVDVQRCSDVPRGTRLFDSLVVFENYPVRTTAAGARAALDIVAAHSRERPKYPLTLVATPGERFSLRIEHDPERFDPATIARMLGHLRTLLEGMAAHPDARPVELPLLTPEERRQLEAYGRPAVAETGGDWLLHERFAAQVARTPDA